MSETDNERKILSALMSWPEGVIHTGELAPRHFMSTTYGEVYKTLCNMYDSKQDIGYTALSSVLVGEWVPAVMAEIASEQTDGGVRILSSIIRGQCAKRETMAILERFKGTLERSKNPFDEITNIMSELSAVADERTTDRLITMYEASEGVRKYLGDPKRPRPIVKTGIRKLDKKSGGVQKGILTLIAGRPSMGKSTFLVNLLFNQALAGEHVYMGSLEDRSRYVASRILSRIANIDAESIVKGGDIGLDGMQRVEEAMDRCSDALKRIYIDDSSGQSVASIKRTCEKLKADGNLDVAYVDHMGEMKKGRDMYIDTTKNAEGLRDIANDLDVPMITGQQVSRSSVKGKGSNAPHTDMIPDQADLRDSGRLEEIARSIWFVHRPWFWDKSQPERGFEVHVAKATHGEPGAVYLECDLSRMIIADSLEELGY
jgi:replicative DNA helicase